MLNALLVGFVAFIWFLAVQKLWGLWQGQRFRIFKASGSTTALDVEEILDSTTSEDFVVVRNLSSVVAKHVGHGRNRFRWKLARSGTLCLFYSAKSNFQILAFADQAIVTTHFTLKQDGTFWVGVGSGHGYEARTTQVTSAVLRVRLIAHPSDVLDRLLA